MEQEQTNQTTTHPIQHISDGSQQDFFKKSKPRLEFWAAGVIFFIASLLNLINQMSITSPTAPLWPAYGVSGAFIFMSGCFVIWLILKTFVAK